MYNKFKTEFCKVYIKYFGLFPMLLYAGEICLPRGELAKKGCPTHHHLRINFEARNNGFLCVQFSFVDQFLGYIQDRIAFRIFFRSKQNKNRSPSYSGRLQKETSLFPSGIPNQLFEPNELKFIYFRVSSFQQFTLQILALSFNRSFHFFFQP